MKLSVVVVLLVLVQVVFSMNEGDYVRVPGGFRHKDCVEFVPTGSVIQEFGAGYNVHFPNGEIHYKECLYPKEGTHYKQLNHSSHLNILLI